MKQARRWLLLIAAIVLVPVAALAADPPKGRNGAGNLLAQAADSASSTSTDTAASGTASASGSAAATDSTEESNIPAAPTSTAKTDICATELGKNSPGCKNKANPAEEAKKTVNAEIYAVQQIYALRYHRFEVEPYYSFTLNDQFVSHDGPGLAVNYYITNVLAIGINGNFYAGLNGDSDFNFQNRRATRVAVPLNEYQWGANLNFTYVPMYGKFAGFSDFIFHYDAYVVGGVGALSTRPIAVIDPDNRNFSYKPKVDFNIGLGVRIFLNRWFAVNLEVRDYIYNEQLENLSVATGPVSKPNDPTSPANPQTWLGDNSLTNNVQAQLGVSIFLPFSWEYRLPK
jgi:outer membrane beta-barrel protein